MPYLYFFIYSLLMFFLFIISFFENFIHVYNGIGMHLTCVLINQSNHFRSEKVLPPWYNISSYSLTDFHTYHMILLFLSSPTFTYSRLMFILLSLSHCLDSKSPILAPLSPFTQAFPCSYSLPRGILSWSSWLKQSP